MLHLLVMLLLNVNITHLLVMLSTYLLCYKLTHLSRISHAYNL